MTRELSKQSPNPEIHIENPRSQYSFSGNISIPINPMDIIQIPTKFDKCLLYSFGKMANSMTINRRSPRYL